MRIAIIAWGSLTWDPRNVSQVENWKSGGPLLPIEFSRVSRDGRLTAVIDYINGSPVKTKYALSARGHVDEAVEELRIREDTARKHIGFVDMSRNDASGKTQANHQKACEVVKGWLAETDFLAAVWTGLLPNFKDKTGRKFGVEEALKYLCSLPIPVRQLSLDYIQSAPLEIDTTLRRKLFEIADSI